MMILLLGNSRKGKTILAVIVGFLGLEGGYCLQRDIMELLGVMEVFHYKLDCGGGALQ